MNPPKFNQIDDMANMTFLNEASVLDNLCQRYTHTRIYDLKGQRGTGKAAWGNGRTGEGQPVLL